MAPTNNRSSQRNGNRSAPRRGRPYRHANTNAGINGSSSSARDGVRARETHCKRPRNGRPRPPANAPSGPSLASRMTYVDGDRRDGRGSGHGASSRPLPQRGRLQDRITHANDSHDGGGGDASHDQRLQRDDTGATLDNDEPEMNDIDDFDFFNDTRVSNPTNFSQASALFCGSQPTQAPAASVPLCPPSDQEELLPPSGPVLTARPHSRTIRMFNEPMNQPANHVPGDEPTTPKRPVNTYRGKDPIKKIVQNKKLQAIFADKPIPGMRKKHPDERVELRMGVSRVLK